jgi:hypothetical protein
VLREPLRLFLVTGAVAAIVGSFISWADGQVPGVGPVTFNPMTTADGVLLPIVAALAAWIGVTESAAESRTRTIQASLAVLGVVAVLVWISALGSADRQVASWGRQTGHGSIGPGIWLAGVGVAVLAISGTILSVRAWRANGVVADPADLVLTRRHVVRALIEVAGGVGGLVGGMVLVLSQVGALALAPMAFAAVFGAAIGMTAGNRLARLVR